MISLKRLCRNCGEPFDAARGNQKYCCYECKMEAAYREKRLAFKQQKRPVMVSAQTVCDTLTCLQRVLYKHGYRLSIGTLCNALRYSSKEFRDSYGVYNIPAVLQFAKENFARFKVRADRDTGSESQDESQDDFEEV